MIHIIFYQAFKYTKFGGRARVISSSKKKRIRITEIHITKRKKKSPRVENRILLYDTVENTKSVVQGAVCNVLYRSGLHLY